MTTDDNFWKLHKAETKLAVVEAMNEHIEQTHKPLEIKVNDLKTKVYGASLAVGILATIIGLFKFL